LQDTKQDDFIMLKIKKEFIDKVRRPEADIEDIKGALNGAVLLEFSTIPPYLTALFSIKKGSNVEARTLVHAIVIEEMLHMTLAANTLIAIGGKPSVLEDGLNLRYPCTLPMCIDEGLNVTLASLTKQQTLDVFMGIERPDTKAILPGGKSVILPGETAPYVDAQPQYDSIGDFYAAVIQKLDDLGPSLFANPRLEQQVDIGKWFQTEIEGAPGGKVSSFKSAQAVLETIVRQGEGIQIKTDKIDPYQGGQELAHYFKFGEIYYGRRLRPDRESVSGWSYSGDPVPLDESNIVNLFPNAAVTSYEHDSDARVAASQFYEAYCRLVRALDETFNGNPARLDSALGIMFELKLVAQQVIQFPAGMRVPVAGIGAPKQVFAAPPFMLKHEDPKGNVNT
jgi:Ferritin-like